MQDQALKLIRHIKCLGAISKGRNWMHREKKAQTKETTAYLELPKEKERKVLSKDSMANMEVIDSEGNKVGNVEDITFTVGNLSVTLILKTKAGENKQIAWEDIQAVGDYVVLRPPGSQGQSTVSQPVMLAEQQNQGQACPTCGGPLTYIPEYNAWYCYKDKKYA